MVKKYSHLALGSYKKFYCESCKAITQFKLIKIFYPNILIFKCINTVSKGFFHNGECKMQRKIEYDLKNHMFITEKVFENGKEK